MEGAGTCVLGLPSEEFGARTRAMETAFPNSDPFVCRGWDLTQPQINLQLKWFGKMLLG